MNSPHRFFPRFFFGGEPSKRCDDNNTNNKQQHGHVCVSCCHCLFFLLLFLELYVSVQLVLHYQLRALTVFATQNSIINHIEHETISFFHMWYQYFASLPHPPPPPLQITKLNARNLPSPSLRSVPQPGGLSDSQKRCRCCCCSIPAGSSKKPREV